MKRALSGQLPLMAAIKKLMDELTQSPSFDDDDQEVVLGREAKVLAGLRKITLLAAGVASQRYMTALGDQQEVMADLSDCIMAVYALESTLLRARKLDAAEVKGAALAAAITSVYADEALGTVEQAARRVLAASADGDTLTMQLTILRRFAKTAPADSIALGRVIAQEVIAAGRYRI